MQAEVQKEMVIHKRSAVKDHFTLSMRIEHLALSPDQTSMSTSALLPTTEEHPASVWEDGSGMLGVSEESQTLHGVEEKIEHLRAQTQKHKHVYQSADQIIVLLDGLSEVHEIARAASIVVSGIYRVIKAKHELNEALIVLYDTMIETYKIAIEKEALNQENQVMDFWNTPSTIADFNNAFQQLKKRFVEIQAEVTTVTVLNTQKAVETLEREKTLRLLRPSVALLGPKSHCLLGTRRSSLSKILDWCFHGEQSILWISGIAGCGKSSLIGTLHNSLSTLGFRSRLAAFIRFDRSAYSNAGEFIKALAFLLASFDERFGRRIAEVVDRSRQITQNTDLSIQVQKLLINPLRGLGEEIAKEGRIVIIVDAIDESSRKDRPETNFREQLLQLFSRDTFALLPFLRFVIASRPEEDILRYLQNREHIQHFPLDHTSPETTSDIHYFLTRSLQHPSFSSLDEVRKTSVVDTLAERASGLFVWAVTVVKFIGENVSQRLDIFTRRTPPKNAIHALRILYQTALESLVNEGDDDIKQNICMALGLTLVAPDIDEDVARNLRGILQAANQSGILDAFGKLQSVVIETTSDGFELLHKSFDDFLTAGIGANQWYIDVEKYNAILMETTMACTMSSLEKSDLELAWILTSNEYRAATLWPQWSINVDISRHPGLHKMLERFLLRYLVRWLRSFHTDLSGWKGCDAQLDFGRMCLKQAKRLENQVEPRHGSELMRKAWIGASRLRAIDKDFFLPLTIKDFFFIMLYDSARDGKVTEVATDNQHALEWAVDNIYMSVFILIAAGSNVYEEIIRILDTYRSLPAAIGQNPIPPVVSLGPEIQIPITIVSKGKIRMDPESIQYVDEESTKDFIEWGWYNRTGDWVPINEVHVHRRRVKSQIEIEVLEV
ncbi:hypothetical protein VNI00_008822 [Paramarasmius palmivorus]|uniref:NACHT domain-containing protein n=1 Tax=Paramarasmius palmivorus TaxID=297713 RepID=A0AAW0CRI7_9AGAR